MLKVYGMKICPDTVECLEALTTAGIPYEYLDFAEKTANLKEFLKRRDSSPLFDAVRQEGNIGIPCIQREDGSITLNWQDIM